MGTSSHLIAGARSAGVGATPKITPHHFLSSLYCQPPRTSRLPCFQQHPSRPKKGRCHHVCRTMSAAGNSRWSDKRWYDRQLDRLHHEAPDDQKTTPEDALRHLPVEYLAEVLDETFKNYETRASGFAERCLVKEEIDTYHAFIKAHQDILQRFDMPAPNYYGDLATIIGTYFIRKKEIQLGITNTSVVKVRPTPASKMPDSPLRFPSSSFHFIVDQ